MEKETWFPFLLQSNSLLTIRIKTAFSLQFFKKAPFHRWFLLKALLKAKVFNSSSFCHIYFQQRLCCNKTEPAFHCNRASVLPKYRLCFVQPTCWRVRAHAQAAISPHFTSLLPTWWIYRSRMVSIYTHHAEYIALPVSLKSWMRWKHSPLPTVPSCTGWYFPVSAAISFQQSVYG